MKTVKTLLATVAVTGIIALPAVATEVPLNTVKSSQFEVGGTFNGATIVGVTVLAGVIILLLQGEDGVTTTTLPI